jgi:phosphonopyruvate decarboxylase
MIPPKQFYETLESEGIGFVAGVPDSLLKEFCAYADSALPPERHMITANEGSAVALAAGVYLAGGCIPLVYMQNSGLGNAVNPLLSLADPAVYGIPMILVVGWRGEPGVKDEPQHTKQGLVSPAILDAMQIPYYIIDGDPEAAQRSAKTAIQRAKADSGPVVLLVRKGSFSKSEMIRKMELQENLLARERSIEHIIQSLPPEAIVIATTGHISRELYELRKRNNQSRSRDFLTVGSMGHASQIALGIHIMRPNQTVVCLDGDGAAIMHLGGMATIGALQPKNFLHVLINNGVHDSVGGQPTVGFQIALTDIARACGYQSVNGPIYSGHEIQMAIQQALEASGPRFIEVHVRPGARDDLGRPTESPRENKMEFIAAIR